MDQDAPSPQAVPESPVSTAPRSALRLWPAILVITAYLCTAAGYAIFASTNYHSFAALVIVPLSTATLLTIWWLFFSRVPVRDRLLGFILVIASLALVALIQPARGWMLLAFALPAMMVGIVVTLAVTFRATWSVRRRVTVAYILLCAGVFLAMRVDSVGGDLAPVVSWRWTPSTAEYSKTLPQLTAHGTASLPPQLSPSDWPEFRGLLRDGCVLQTTFSTDWATPPQELWRRKIGPAWSSFAVVGDYLFTQEQRGEDELVTCYRADTGEEVWANGVQERFDDAMGLGPRATPTFRDGKLYTQGVTGILQCLDASTGATLWKRDLRKDSGADIPAYGFASSPLVTAKHVIAYSNKSEGKSVNAYDRETGDIVWQGGKAWGGYSSPQIAVFDKTAQILMVTSSGLQSHDPQSGALLWENTWKIDVNARCVQPLVVSNDLVMFGATGAFGSRLLRVQQTNNAWQATEVWTTKAFRPYFNDGVLHKNFCYGYDGERLVCLDLNNGQRRWQGKRMGGQLLLLPDMETLLVLSEEGDVILVKAAPDRYEEIARFHAISGKTWNHPVIAHGRLIVRNSEEAACFALPNASR